VQESSGVIVFQCGDDEGMDTLCVCEDHIKMAVCNLSPLLRVWLDTNRQNQFIEQLLKNIAFVPLQKKKYETLKLLTESITMIPPKFHVLPILEELIALGTAPINDITESNSEIEEEKEKHTIKEKKRIKFKEAKT